MTLMSLNLPCKFCPYCELIILRKDQFEQILTGVAQIYFPEVMGNDYFVMGTLDRALHRLGKAGKLTIEVFLRECVPFKDELHLEIRPAGWYPAEG
jgi:hypothetical protein